MKRKFRYALGLTMLCVSGTAGLAVAYMSVTTVANEMDRWLSHWSKTR